MSPYREGLRLLCVDAADIEADAVALDALARFALLARRRGYRVILRRPSRELADLIELAGLCDALPIDPARPASSPPSG